MRNLAGYISGAAAARLASRNGTNCTQTAAARYRMLGGERVVVYASQGKLASVCASERCVYV